MKRTTCCIALAGIFASANIWAAEAPVVLSTMSVEVSSQPDRAITERPGRGLFVSLTRTAFPVEKLPTSADVVTPDLFKRFDAQNAGDAVARQTSIQTLPRGYLGAPMSAQIRGADPLVMIDGRPVASMSFGPADLTEIPVENIDHVEIQRGGMSSLYGPNAAGGVINILTPRASYAGKPVSNVGYESRSYGHQIYRLNFGSRAGPVDYFFFANQQWQSGFRDNSDARSHNIGGNAGWSMGSAGKLLFDIGAFHRHAGIPGPACGANDLNCLSAPGSYLMPNQFNNKDEKLGSTPAHRATTDNNYLRSSYLLPLPHSTLLTLRLFGSQREVDSDNTTDPVPSNATHTDRHENSKGGEVQYNMPWGLTAGGSFIHDREDHTDILSPGNTFHRSAENYGAYLQEDYHNGLLTIIPSGRYDHTSEAGDTFNPRVQAIADSTEWLRFSGSAARSFRAPTLDQRYLQTGGNLPFTGNPSLRPETAWTYDAGFELHADSVSFRATYFRANTSDLIQLRPITYDTAVNIDSARRQGMEVQLNHTLNRFFKDSWNYTYLENLGTPPGYDHRVVLAFSPRHTVNYLATVTPAKRWTIDNTLRFEDQRYAGNDQTGMVLRPQLVWDMRLAYQWRQMECFLGVNDITDRRYLEQPGYPLPGRTAYGGVSLKLWE